MSGLSKIEPGTMHDHAPSTLHMVPLKHVKASTYAGTVLVLAHSSQRRRKAHVHLVTCTYFRPSQALLCPPSHLLEQEASTRVLACCWSGTLVACVL